MKKALIIFCLLLCVGIGSIIIARTTAHSTQSLQHPNTQPLFPEYRKQIFSLAGNSITVYIAETSKQRAQGLSDVVSLPDTAGMLFVFDTIDQHGFWMNRMHFPLDILWVRDGIIVDLWENAPAPTPEYPIPQSHLPRERADRVYEFTGGFAARYHLKKGDLFPPAQPGQL